MKIATAAEMHELGKRIGLKCRAGDLILINGPLGAGKTVLVQGVGEALGIHEVTSPTFVISRIHQAALPLIHIDAYRLIDSESAAAFLDDLDIDTPREGAVTVIEWGGAESARLSEERLEITINRSIDFSAEVRDVQVTAIGARWQGFSL